jgi:hypothetical protein
MNSMKVVFGFIARLQYHLCSHFHLHLFRLLAYSYIHIVNLTREIADRHVHRSAVGVTLLR